MTVANNHERPSRLGLNRWHQEEEIHAAIDGTRNVTKLGWKWMLLCDSYHKMYDYLSLIFYKIQFPFLILLADILLFALATDKRSALIFVGTTNLLALVIWAFYKVNNHGD